MYRIGLCNELSPVIHKALPKERFVIGKEIGEPDAILVRSASLHDTSFPPSLKAIARAGAGVNNIPVDRCNADGIVVFNTPGANANAVKEMVIAAMLLSTRHVVEGVEWVRGLDGKPNIPKLVEAGKSQFAGPELYGKTLGVIGLGAVGAMVANVAHSLRMNVQGYDPYLSVEGAWRLSRAVKHAASLDAMLAEADIVTIHMPLLEGTRGIFDASMLMKMKPGAILLNFARGELVDNNAVLAVLASGRLAYYVTDFPNETLLGKKNVLCIPHLGASTPESEENCATMASQQLADFLEHGTIHNSVNYPDCELPRTEAFRICMFHGNVTNVLGRIAATIGEAGYNIANMINKSRGAQAITVLDLDEAPAPEVVKALEAVEAVVRVRVIGMPQI